MGQHPADAPWPSPLPASCGAVARCSVWTYVWRTWAGVRMYDPATWERLRNPRESEASLQRRSQVSWVALG